MEPQPYFDETMDVFDPFLDTIQLVNLPVPEFNVDAEHVEMTHSPMYSPLPLPKVKEIPPLIHLCLRKFLENPLLVISQGNMLPSRLKGQLLQLIETFRVPSEGELVVLLNNEFTHSLDISKYPHITLPSLQRLVDSCFSTLQYLNLNNYHHQLDFTFPYELKGLFKLTVNNCKITNVFIESLLLHCPNLRSFSMNNITSKAFSSIFNVLRHSKVRELDISKLNVNNDEKNQIIDLCRTIQLVSLKCSHSVWLHDEVLTNMLSGQPNLQQLDVAECYNLTDAAITEIIPLCPNIKSINLSNCWEITDKAVEMISQQCRNLEEIIIDGCTSLTDDSLSALAKNNSAHLINISFKDCESMTSSGICALLSRCKLLQKINLSSLSYEQTNLVEQLGNGVRELNFQGNEILLSKHELCQLAKTCPRIESFTISRNFFVSASAIKSIVKQWKDLRNLSMNYCIQVNDQVLHSVAKHCNLKTLSLVGCSGVSDKALQRLIPFCEELESIDLSEVPNVSNKSVKLLAKHCPALQVAHFAGCKKVTSQALKELIRSCQKLTAFSCEKLSSTALTLLGNCQKLANLKIGDAGSITDEAIVEFSSQAKNLQELNIKHSEASSSAFSQCVENCYALEYLYLSDCRNLDEAVLPALAKSTIQSIFISQCNINISNISNFRENNSRVTILGQSSL